MSDVKLPENALVWTIRKAPPVWNRERAPIRTAVKSVREFFEILDREGITSDDVAKLTGISPASFHFWRQGRVSPSVFNFEAALQAVGLKLALVPADEPDVA